ncbi:hypothetical protein [Microbacterium sp. GXF6406]
MSDGVLRIGVSPDPGLISGTDQSPDGPLIDIAEEFASSIDATAVWSIAAEETLVEELETGEIDIAIGGGFTDQTPWSDRAGVTRGYTGIEGADGRSIVFLVPLGENDLLTAVEMFLDDEVGS